jgi:tetratricopeptide (TPR) repeat protein
MEMHIMKRLTTIAALLFCLVINAAAAPAVPAKDTWTSVRSKNFYLIGNASEKEIRQVATRLEQFRYVFTRLLPNVNFTSPVPTTVIVFKSDSSYKPYKPVVDGKVSSNVAGYFQSGRDVNYITLTTEKQQENPYSTIFHEYVHLLVNNTMGESSIPPWFNEGLAEYYSTFDIEDNQKVYLGNLISNHLQLLRQQQLWPLKTLFGIDYYSLHRNKGEAKSFFYAQSWALVHYLILGNNGQRQQQLGQFLRLLLSKMPVEKAFQEAFQTDFATMEKELKKYVSAGSYRGKVATFENKLEFETEMQTAPISEADAFAYLGDLLQHTNRPEDAEARLNQALALEPNHSLALASLGMVRLRQKRFSEARELLKKAVEAGTQNYMAHYYYAFVLSREDMNDAEYVSNYSAETARVIRAELNKVIELKPDFPESYYLLAFVNMVTGSQLDESIALMKKALALSPGNENYAFVLAQVYLHKRDFEPAKALLSQIVQTATEPQMRATAQSMLESISSMQARRARNDSDERPDNGVDTKGGRDNPPLRRRETSAETPPSGQGAPPPASKPFDQLSALREVLREVQSGEKRVQGVLVRIDCDAKGIVFTIRVGEGLITLHVEKFEDMDISTYTTDVGGEITCGPRKLENVVIVTYRPSTGGRSKGLDGEAVALEFVPKEFVLEKK